MPSKVTVPVPGVNVPLSNQLPPRVRFKLFAFNVPELIVTSLVKTNELVINNAFALALFTNKFPISLVEFIWIV